MNIKENRKDQTPNVALQIVPNHWKPVVFREAIVPICCRVTVSIRADNHKDKVPTAPIPNVRYR